MDSEYEGMLAETVKYPGHKGDNVLAYYARPAGPGPFPGVVVIHGAPGWDEWCKEVARRLAHHGYAAVLPNLYTRLGPGSVDEVAAKARADGGTPDEQMLGDVAGSIAFLRQQTQHNGKVGIIGFCSGGRQVYMSACRLQGIDAAVDCWGGGVGADPPRTSPRQPVPPLDFTKDLSCPLLGIFGAEDEGPSPADVARTEAELKKHGKTYQFHSYQGAGHAFFNWSRPSYRQEQAMDGWTKVFAWYEKYLKTPAQAESRAPVTAGR